MTLQYRSDTGALLYHASGSPDDLMAECCCFEDCTGLECEDCSPAVQDPITVTVSNHGIASGVHSISKSSGSCRYLLFTSGIPSWSIYVELLCIDGVPKWRGRAQVGRDVSTFGYQLDTCDPTGAYTLLATEGYPSATFVVS